MQDVTHLIGYIVDERYELLRPLGKGGMGAVFAASDREEAREVALKLAPKPKRKGDETLEKRMKREVKVLMLVEDTRIVQLLDWGQDDRLGFYYTMELLTEGQTLTEHLNTHQLDLRTKLELFVEILTGLQALHELRVIHRDLKPSNVICVPRLDAQAGVKLIDPGIAKWFSDDLRDYATIETLPGELLGTPLYMPPEMWCGEEIDTRTDIYQAGIMGYELITEKLPFKGDMHQLMYHHLCSPFPDLTADTMSKYPHIPESLLENLNTIFQTAVHKKPAERYQDICSFSNEIQQFLMHDELSPSLHRVAPPHHPKHHGETAFSYHLPTAEREVEPALEWDPTQGRRRLLSVILGLLLLTVIVGAWWVGRHTAGSLPTNKNNAPPSQQAAQKPSTRRLPTTHHEPGKRAKQHPRSSTRSPKSARKASQRQKQPARRRSNGASLRRHPRRDKPPQNAWRFDPFTVQLEHK